MVSAQATSEPAPEPRPGPTANAVFLRPLDEVGNDQEVAAEPHAVDDRDLELEPLAVVENFFPDARFDQLRMVGGDRFGIGAKAEHASEFGVGAFRVIGFKSQDEALAAVLGAHPRLAFLVAGKAGQDRLALGRHDRAALRHDQRVGERFGQVLEQFLHDRRGLDPPFLAGARAIRAIDMGGTGDAEHGIVRIVESPLCKAGGVRANQRQVPRVCEIDERGFGRFLHRIVAPGYLDVEPFGEEFEQPVDIGLGGALLASGKKLRQCAFAGGGKADQAVGMADEIRQDDVRRKFERPVEMGAADEVAKVVIAPGILRIEGQPVDRRCGRTEARCRAVAFGTGYGEHRADDRLDAHVLARLGIGHATVEPVAICDGGGGKAPLGGGLGDGLRVDGAVEHRVGREDAKRDEGGMGHVYKVGKRPRSCERRGLLFHQTPW